MTVANFLPLVLALCCCAPVVAARYHAAVDRRLTRVSLALFGGYADQFRSEHPDRRAALRGAHLPVTYREYGAKTLLYAALFAVLGAVLGIYVIWGLLLVLSIDPETLRDAVPSVLSFLATLGAVAGGATYWLRWWYPSHVAEARARRIEAALPSTVAFVYALSKSGMAFAEVIRIVAAQTGPYGEAAAEFEVAVRSMDTFGLDVITALRTMGRRSPSPQFREFTENLVSVLQSGHSLSAFLERQYHDYQTDAESQQERTLGLLATLAEAYVTVLVAGPLFLITILVVIGIAAGDTLDALRALIYLLLPLGNLAFVIYLSVVTDRLAPGSTAARAAADIAPVGDATGIARADGGTIGSRPHPNVERVRYARRVQRLRDRFGDPVNALLERPARSLAITVPIALAAVCSRLPAALEGGFDVAVIDDIAALGALFVLVGFAGCYEYRRSRIAAVEAAIPDLLDRLASVNEAGVPIVAAVDHVRGSDLGPLGVELDRVRADVRWGADLQSAFGRLAERASTRSTSRIVALLTEAMNASGNLATVLRITSRQAAADRRLERERGQAMVKYLLVVYVSFLVFLFIIAVLAAYLLPNLPMETTDAGVGTTTGDRIDDLGLGGFSPADYASYRTLFYHATLVQGLLSGLIAGQLSTGDLGAGAKHAAAMVGLSVVLFAVLV